ncbi:M4 family metallopeptidase [Streptosporangium sp. NPDC020072]|uniref:M4 family metallopeptidase n=1 Tax=unclassified Streptosporangium TaxID=2632669 RepID=UPI0034181E1D
MNPRAPKVKVGATAFVTVVAMGTSALAGLPARAAPDARSSDAQAPSAFAPPGAEARERAASGVARILAERAGELRVGPGDAFEPPVITSGVRGLQYLLYRRTHHGLPVYGGDVIASADSGGTTVGPVTTGQQVSLEGVGTVAGISAGDAASVARAQGRAVREVGTPRLLIHATTTRPRLAWEVAVTGGTEQAPEVLRVFVDALDASVIGTHDQVRYGLGNSFYNGNPVTIQTTGSGGSFVMRDPTRPGLACGGQNGTPYSKSVDTWGNGTGTNLETACVDVLFAAQKEWDMLRTWLGRDGLDGAGHAFPARVGLNQVNAYWNGSYISLGHNQSNTRQAASLDLVGHEYGHAVYQHSGSDDGGTPEALSLSESSGDIFGAATEHYVNHAPPLDPPNYLIGEDLGFGPEAVHNMYNPSLQGEPNCYTALSTSPGPQDHWFYLLAEGTSPQNGPPSPVCGGPTPLTGIGIRKATEIFYSGLQYKTAPWTYAKARMATLRAAKALYPKSCAEYNATKAAWTAISVPAQRGEPGCL